MIFTFSLLFFFSFFLINVQTHLINLIPLSKSSDKQLKKTPSKRQFAQTTNWAS